MEEEVSMTCQDCQPDPNFFIETSFSATITGPLYSLGPGNDLKIGSLIQELLPISLFTQRT
eukprot:3961728-Ditylum_brightwellii.AAC.1